MKILHINVETEDGWLIAQGLEEPGLITQARTLDELFANIREVVYLLEIGDKDLHIELIVPPSVRRFKRPTRMTQAKAGVRGKFKSAAALSR